jgi:hypothetical protein
MPPLIRDWIDGGSIAFALCRRRAWSAHQTREAFMRVAASALVAAGLVIPPLSAATAQDCSFPLAWPFCIAGAAVNTAATIATAPFYAAGPYYYPGYYPGYYYAGYYYPYHRHHRQHYHQY